MLTIITNKKNKTYFIKKFKYVGVNNPSDFIINNLDLSLEWDYKDFNPLNKGDLIKYIILFDDDIKEIDTAINCILTKEYRDLDLDYKFFATAYFNNGKIKVINLLEFFALRELKLKNTL